jgi:hypothetical protein
MRKNVVLWLLCIFIVAPAGAWLTAYLQKPDYTPIKTVSTVANNDILSALKQYDNLLVDSEKFTTPSSIQSVQKMDSWWYLVIVKLQGSSETGDYVMPAIVSKFADDHAIRVVVAPESGPISNISNSRGVPYDVIDAFNRTLEDQQ